MSYLYKNVKGYEVKSHSYSAGQDFKCPRKYYLKRSQGWVSKEEGVALFFGKSVESAIQYYHNKGFEVGSGVDEFRKLWFLEKDNTELKYSEKSGDWTTHYRMGSELLGLYEAMLPELPVQNEKFQVKFEKELFPGTEYSDLKFTAIADVVSEVPGDHPFLPFKREGRTKIVIDIKTSSASYFTDPRLASLDPQLRYYSWATGIDVVAFLVLVKNASGLDTGDWVTVLKGPKSGKKFQALDVNEDRVLLLNKTEYEDFQTRKKGIKGKGSKDAQEVLLAEYAYKAIRVLPSEVTKQRIQFLPAVITQEDREEVEYEAKKEVMEIAGCSEANYWPRKPGVRFPSNHCLSCEMLGHCIGDKDLVKEKLIQITGVF